MLSNEELYKKVEQMFYDYESLDKQRGALECIEEIVGEGYRTHLPYLQAYLLRKGLNYSNPLFVIHYGKEDTHRNIEPFAYVIRILFITEKQAKDYVESEDGLKKINDLPFVIKEI